jgi:NitT/TauT family transport system permease protein
MRRRAAARQWALAIAAHVLLVAVWWGAVVFGHIPNYVMPTPLATVETLANVHNQWLSNTLVTATEIFGGYIVAVIFGIVAALAFSWSRLVENLAMPLMVSLNMIPKVALGPLFIVWFKYGVIPNSFIAFTICFFPILLTTTRGLREVEPELLDLVRSLGGSRWQLFVKIQLPGSLPYLFSGMKVGAVLAVAGAIVGEFLGSAKGLGYLMLQVQSTLDTATMFMSVIMITLVGVVLYGIVVLLERAFVVRDARVR